MERNEEIIYAGKAGKTFLKPSKYLLSAIYHTGGDAPTKDKFKEIADSPENVGLLEGIKNHEEFLSLLDKYRCEQEAIRSGNRNLFDYQVERAPVCRRTMKNLLAKIHHCNKGVTIPFLIVIPSSSMPFREQANCLNSIDGVNSAFTIYEFRESSCVKIPEQPYLVKGVRIEKRKIGKGEIEPREAEKMLTVEEGMSLLRFFPVTTLCYYGMIYLLGSKVYEYRKGGLPENVMIPFLTNGIFGPSFEACLESDTSSIVITASCDERISM